MNDSSYALFYSTNVVGTHWSYSFKYVRLEALEPLCSGVCNCLINIYRTLVPFLKYFLLDYLEIAPLIFEECNELSCLKELKL